MPHEPTFTTAGATATTTAATTAAAASRPISPLPHQPHPHPHPHYPSPQQQHQHQHQQQQPFYSPQQQQQPPPLPIRAPAPHLPKPHDPSRPFLYPFGGGGGFLPKGVRPLAAADHVAGYLPPPPPALVYSHGVRAMASPHLDYINHALHMTTRPPHLQYPHLAPAAAAAAASSGIAKATAAVPAHGKAAPRFAVSDSNGYKDASTRERSRDDTFSVVRDRRVRVTEDASLYALCRSWLRNGINEESQPQQKDVMKALPKPLPASMVASHMSNKKEDEKDKDEQEESEKSVDHLSPQELLKRHIKRAKRVRARLREERLQRITRYRSRLRLLLPPPAEQMRNDTAAGN